MTNAKFPLVALRRFVKINPNVVLPTKGEVEYLPMEKVRSGYFEHSVADIATLPSSLNAFAEGDVLMAKVTPCFENGNLCLASNIRNQVGCCSTELFVLRPNTSLVLPEYLIFLLQAEEFKQTATKYMRGAGGLKRIPTDWLLDYKFPLPSIDAQTLILRFLRNVESKVRSISDACHHKIGKLSEYKQSLITQAVTKGLDPNVEMKDSGVPWWVSIPSQWYVEKLGYFAKTKSGATPSSSNRSYYEDGIHNWVRTTDLNLGEISDTPVKLTELALKETACQYVPKDSVLIAMYGGAGTVGKYGLLQVESTLNQAVCAIFPNGKVLPKYLFYQVAAFRKYWMAYALSTRKDPNISQEDIQRWKVFIPPLKEQNDIIQYLDKKVSEIDAVSTHTQHAIELLTEYRSSLISAAVTGKISCEEVDHES